MDMMDSLELPHDMFWSGKTEPPSPDRLPSKCSFNNDLIVGNADEFWPIEDNLLSSFAIDEESAAGQNETKIRPEELLKELIEFKEEGQWFNQENVDLSVFTAAAEASFLAPEANAVPMAFPSPPLLLGSIYPAVSPGLAGAGHHQHQINKLEGGGNSHVAATELLFNEIKNICSDFEAGYQHLTPPQSPPPTYPLYGHHHQPQQQQQQQQHLQQPQLSGQPPSMTCSTDLFECGERSFVDLQLQSSECLDKTFVGGAAAAQDPDLIALELIDELLRTNGNGHKIHVTDFDQFQQIPVTGDEAHANAMTDEDYCDESSTQFSTPSYGNSLASSPTRSGSPMDSQEDDEEWMPSTTQGEKKTGSPMKYSSSASSSKRRPYARGGEVAEKKTRKKEQNKNAATRYRQKKKQEIEEILAEENKLRKVHKKLQTQFSDAKREVKYLKNLLRDMYKQNNIII